MNPTICEFLVLPGSISALDMACDGLTWWPGSHYVVGDIWQWQFSVSPLASSCEHGLFVSLRTEGSSLTLHLSPGPHPFLRSVSFQLCSQSGRVVALLTVFTVGGQDSRWTSYCIPQCLLFFSPKLMSWEIHSWPVQSSLWRRTCR